MAALTRSNTINAYRIQLSLMLAILAGCAGMRPDAIPSSSIVDTDSARAVKAMIAIEKAAPTSAEAWPGFDLSSQIIIAALDSTGPLFLMGDPSPPAGFKRLEGSRKVFSRSRYPSDPSFSILTLAGDWNGRMGVATSMLIPPSWVQHMPHSLIHESFHTYQANLSKRQPTRFTQVSPPKFPRTSLEAIALLNLEGSYLGDAIRSSGQPRTQFIRLAIAVRSRRCSVVGQEECGAERGVELNEGSATYVESEMLNEVQGFGREGVWQDSIARAISNVSSVQMLDRWIFYQTGFVWLKLIAGQVRDDGWKREVELMPPDLMLAHLLGLTNIPPSLMDSAISGARWETAQSSARALLQTVPVVSKVGIPIRMHFGRVRTMGTRSQMRDDGQPEETLTFGQNTIVLVGASEEFLGGEIMFAEVTGKVILVDRVPVPLDVVGQGRGALSLDIPNVKLTMPRGEVQVFRDSIVIRPIEQ